MKPTGIVRKVDQLGRIVLPIEMRRLLNIGWNDEVNIYFEEGRVTIAKSEMNCLFCGSESETYFFKRKLVCKSCIQELPNVTSIEQ
ncbi:AbrB/MazE/SpoVT family DNA-binding domain-containing protein [Paenibacillus aceris]|uniref:Transcriptional pleiotropic regulator of transition state genes n=1 Tax=Paenibacillus aceris TaxID=869555 RepID=A0ABS4I0M5_9BACL|nr:AbrB/MazE/SpoVT family DNA-binding domain-containing protein [Paenibacillus aceris]MBP1964468.1 transcriptional pleiotropic regulator of transition state genes [Paenibacillus aceris]NHW35819.1 AbrB family transcriptional regulator [Paenibacillus aceris]